MPTLKLFMVLSIFGNTVGTIGPLPYGIKECARRTSEMTATFEVAWLQKQEIKFDGRIVTPDDVRVSCVRTATEPPLANAVTLR